MADAAWITALLVGFLGGAHCVAMCGGIVGALSLHRAEGGGARFGLHLGYNLGRLVSYSLAGALAGGVGQLAALGTGWGLRWALYALANLMLLGMGLYLLGEPRLLAPVERLGAGLWRKLQPLSRRFLPARTFQQAFFLGLLWGWLPCGLVYSALTSALATASPIGGAAVMLAFGLGTLPNLLAMGWFAQRLASVSRRPGIRRGAGLLVLAFGVYGLWALIRHGVAG